MSNLAFEQYQTTLASTHYGGLEMRALGETPHFNLSSSRPKTLGAMVRLIMDEGSLRAFAPGGDYVAFDIQQHEDWSLVDDYFRQQGFTVPCLSIVTGSLLLRLYPERAITFRFHTRQGGHPGYPYHGTVDVLAVGEESGYISQDATPAA